MGDSDEDYDRRRDRRDKFRRERSDYQEPSRGRREGWGEDDRGGGARGGWNRDARRGGGRDDYGRDMGYPRRDRYSPGGDRGEGPPMKRMRQDEWGRDGGGYGRGGYDNYDRGHGAWGGGEPPQSHGNSANHGNQRFVLLLLETD